MHMTHGFANLGAIALRGMLILCVYKMIMVRISLSLISHYSFLFYSKIKVGPPDDDSVFIGALVSKQHFDKVHTFAICLLVYASLMLPAFFIQKSLITAQET